MMYRQFILILTVMFTALAAKAQFEPFRFDAGVQSGVSGYLGDANTSSIFHKPGISAALTGRYRFNARMALKLQAGVTRLSGDTADFDNMLPEGENFSFKSAVYDLGLRYEFNFFPYGIGPSYKQLRRISPYVTAGAGVAIASTGGTTVAAPCIPLGVGVKYKLAPRLNLCGEFTMTKVLSDRVDGRSLSDPYGIKSSVLKNTDWYSNIAISITYEFGERCEDCNYVD